MGGQIINVPALVLTSVGGAGSWEQTTGSVDQTSTVNRRYTDNTKWPPEGLPADFLNMVQLVTDNAGAGGSFSISIVSQIFVGWRDAASKPGWLDSTWADSGYDFIDATVTVYVKVFDAGLVTLASAVESYDVFVRAGYQSLVSPPVSLTGFDPITYNPSEEAGTVTLTVKRAGTGLGALQVSWSLSDGTATAGIDYTDDNGTLNWADSNVDDKTFNVTIIDRDAVEQGNLTFLASLVKDSGLDSIGPAVATVTIQDQDTTPATPDRFVRSATASMNPGSDSDDGLTVATAWATHAFAAANASANELVETQADTAGGSNIFKDDPIGPFTNSGITFKERTGDTITLQGPDSGPKIEFVFDFNGATDCIIDGYGADGKNSHWEFTDIKRVADYRNATRCKLINLVGTRFEGFSGLLTAGAEDCQLTDFTLSLLGIHVDGPGSGGIDQGNGIEFAPDCKRFLLARGVFDRFGAHDTITDEGENNIVEDLKITQRWNGTEGISNSLAGGRAITTESDRGGASYKTATGGLYQRIRMIDCGGDTDEFRARITKPMGKDMLFRYNLYKNNATADGFSIEYDNDQKKEEVTGCIHYGETFYNMGRGMGRVFWNRDDPAFGPFADVVIFNQVMQLMRQNPGVDSRDDNDFNTIFQGAGGLEILDDLTVDECQFESGADVFNEGAPGDDQKTLTEAETDISGTFFNNDQGSVSFPDATGETFADFELTTNFGRPHTTLNGAVSNDNVITVFESRVFRDGMGHIGRPGDTIYVGGTLAIITNIVFSTHVITLDRNITASDGAACIESQSYDAGNVRRGVVV